MYRLLILSLFISTTACKEIQHSIVLSKDLPQLLPAGIEADGIDSSATYLLIHEPSGSTFVTQWSEGRLIFLPSISMKAGEVLRVTKSELSPPPRMNIVITDSLLEVVSDSSQILRYHLAISQPPDTLPSYFQRSGFIHPLFSPNGEILTADFPRGHAHQHGIFHAFVNTKFRGKEVDFWNQAKEQGTVRHKDVLMAKAGPLFTHLKLQLEQVAFVDKDTVVVLREEWGLDVFDLGDIYLIDFEIGVSCPYDDSLLVDLYHYGGLAFRGNDEWNAGESAYDSLVFFTTSEGKSQVEANHTQPRWVAMFGDLGVEQAGVAMMGHRDNFRHPQPVRIHPSMPYFCFAPMVQGPYTIRNDEVHSNRYRLLAYDGQPDPAFLEKAWMTFSGDN